MGWLKDLLAWQCVLLAFCVTEMQTSNDFVMPVESSESKEDLLMTRQSGAQEV